MLEAAKIKARNLVLPSGHLTTEFIDLDRVPPLELADAYARKVNEFEAEYGTDALAFFAKPSYMQLAPTTLMGTIAERTKKSLVQVDLRNPDWTPVRIKGGESKRVIVIADAVYLPDLYETGVDALTGKDYSIKGAILAHPSPKEQYPSKEPEKIFAERDIPIRYLEEVELPQLKRNEHDLFTKSDPTFSLVWYLSNIAQTGKEDNRPLHLWDLGDGIRSRRLLESSKGVQSIMSFMLPGIVDHQRAVYVAGSSNQCITFNNNTKKKFEGLYKLLGTVANEIGERNELKAFGHFRDFTLKAEDFSDVKIQ